MYNEERNEQPVAAQVTNNEQTAQVNNNSFMEAMKAAATGKPGKIAAAAVITIVVSYGGYKLYGMWKKRKEAKQVPVEEAKAN